MSPHPKGSFRHKLHEIIFEAETPGGKIFDVLLLCTIVASVVVVLLETVEPLHDEYGRLFYTLEWIFTIVFTIEYLLRIYSVMHPRTYMLSFYGIIDLLAILPTYLSLVVAGTQSLLVLRALRLLRVFRIFKLVHFLNEGRLIMAAVRNSAAKITVFLFFILLLEIIIGAVMYLVEGGANDTFSSIPQSIYWAIVTLTTVGYGDITPITNLGKFLSALVMMIGYAIIAVPTGIISAELVRTLPMRKRITTEACESCGRDVVDPEARFCKYCGEKLNA
jgi:voltage-gated potassium channel